MEERNNLLPNDHSLSSATVQALWRKDWCPCIPARFVIVLWCFLGLFCMYALRATLSIAILVMVKEGDSEDSQDTVTQVHHNGIGFTALIVIIRCFIGMLQSKVIYGVIIFNNLVFLLRFDPSSI